jgi:hypothetical protein
VSWASFSSWKSLVARSWSGQGTPGSVSEAAHARLAGRSGSAACRGARHASLKKL